MATATYFNCWTTLLRYAVNWKSSVELKSRQVEHSLSLSIYLHLPLFSPHSLKGETCKIYTIWQRELFKEKRNPLPYCYMSKLYVRVFLFLCSCVYTHMYVYVCIWMRACMYVCESKQWTSFSFTWPKVECIQGSLVAPPACPNICIHFCIFFSLFFDTLTE